MKLLSHSVQLATNSPQFSGSNPKRAQRRADAAANRALQDQYSVGVRTTREAPPVTQPEKGAISHAYFDALAAADWSEQFLAPTASGFENMPYRFPLGSTAISIPGYDPEPMISMALPLPLTKEEHQALSTLFDEAGPKPRGEVTQGEVIHDDYTQLERYHRLEAGVKDILKVSPSSGRNPLIPFAMAGLVMLPHAQLLEKLGFVDAAREKYTEIEESAKYAIPGSDLNADTRHFIYSALGDFALREGQPKRALAYYDRAQKTGWGKINPRYKVAEAKAHLAMLQPNKAIAAYEGMMKLLTDSPHKQEEWAMLSVLRAESAPENPVLAFAALLKQQGRTEREAQVRTTWSGWVSAAEAKLASLPTSDDPYAAEIVSVDWFSRR
ncbi:MAG: hypothetical protein K2X01_00255 [Cyanobacteria bacterium]|nr:hypothetical protein [Cyanobacteriota bacterium]